MNRGDWIVCERTTRWAAALRTAIARQVPAFSGQHRVVEVRSLGELAQRLNLRTDGFGLIELDRSNLDSVLRFLSDARQYYPPARFAALLNRDFADYTHRVHDRQVVADALLEAGAVAIADSPRELRAIVQLARRHGDLAAALPRGDQSFVEWAHSLLPWQE